MTDSDNFYVSGELSEVIDLVFQQLQLKNDIGLAVHQGNSIPDLLYLKYQQVTARLETLVIKRDD